MKTITWIRPLVLTPRATTLATTPLLWVLFYSFSSILICVPQPPQEEPRGNQEGALEAVGQSPANSNDIADVWIGGVDNRGIATKFYRGHSSGDFPVAHAVCRTYLCCVPCRLKVYRLYQQRSIREMSVVSHLSHQDIVPFIGTYSTSKHPMSLVFDYGDTVAARQLRHQSVSIQFSLEAFELLRSNDPYADIFVSDSIRTLSFKADSGGAQEGLLSAVIPEFIVDVQSEPELAPNGTITAYMQIPIHALGGHRDTGRLGLVRLHRILSVIHDLITPRLAN